MNTLVELSSFKNGLPYAFDKKMVCPLCSISTISNWKSERQINEPVFLIIRTNKTTNQKFLGCPNFPKCKHSDDILSIRKEKQENERFNFDWNDELRDF